MTQLIQIKGTSLSYRAVGGMNKDCGQCHTCGTEMRQVLDGEEWCVTCKAYRRYRSHGWALGCPAIHETSRYCPTSEEMKE